MQDHVQDKISFVEIVAAVIFKSMSGADDNSLSHASSAAKNYGTVTTRVEPGYIEHVVEKTDTLQGIALKYGTTVRRGPRYWASYKVTNIITCHVS